MNRLSKLSKAFMLIFLSAVFTATSYAQCSPIAYYHGFNLKKCVSLSSVRTEQVFQYTIHFTIEDGATNVVIKDIVPPSLYIDYVGALPSYSGNVATLNQMGNTVTLTFPGPVAGPITGTFQINVHFPSSKICNGSGSANNSCDMQGTSTTGAFEIKTNPVQTTCTVTNPWHIQKYPNHLPYIGGTCPYGTLSDTVEYTLKITKTYMTAIGAEKLKLLNIQDIMPASAYAIPASYNVTTPVSGTIFIPGSITSTGLITVSGGGLSLEPANNMPYVCTFKIVFPPIPVGDCVKNIATMNAEDSCHNPRVYKDSISVKKLEYFPVNGVLNKWATTTGNLPGCTGIYYIRVSNNSAFTTLPPYVLTDNIPGCLVVGTPIVVPTGCSYTMSSPNDFTFQGIAIPPLGVHIYQIPFTIGAGCAPTFTNTVFASGTGLPSSASWTIALLPPGATPCIYKAICNPTPSHYSIGDVVHFRIRLQNIGGTAITNANVTDYIDLSNLAYNPGSVTSYQNINAANLPCDPPIGGGVQPWSVSTIYDAGTGHLTFNNINIPVQCSSIPNPVCGSAYLDPAFYIEFDATIIDTAGIGNIRNIATVQGGNITTPATDDVTFLTNGNVDYIPKKFVSVDNGNNYSPSATTSAGSTVRYRLNVVNSGLALTSPLLVDLLPRDNIPNDNFITYQPVLSRGSTVDTRYTGNVASTHTIASQWYDDQTGIKTTDELGVTVGSVSPNWLPSVYSNTKNIRTYLQQAIGASPLNYDFDAQVSGDAKIDDIACNTFALVGYIKYLTNYIADYQKQPVTESAKACVSIVEGDSCCPPVFNVPDHICTYFDTKFCAVDTCPHPGRTYYWDFGDGTGVQTGNCITHAYLADGSYTIVVKWDPACPGEEADHIFQVEVKKCPCDVNVSWVVNTSGLAIVADGSGTTSSQLIGAYIWNFGDGSVGTGQVATHTYAAPGTYFVQLTVYTVDASGNICHCVDKCGDKVTVTYDSEKIFGCRHNDDTPSRTSAPKENINLSMSAVPNPFTDKISVRFTRSGKDANNDQKTYTLQFMDANGVVLQTSRLQNLISPVNLDTKNYSSGVYFLLLRNNTGQTQNIKVVKLK